MRRSFRPQTNPPVRETPAPRRFAWLLLGLLLAGLGWALLSAPVHAAEPAGGLTTDWTAAETDHFRFFVQTPDQTVADAVAVTHGAAAEAAFAELSLLFAIPPPPEKIAIYVYTDPAAYDAGVAAAARRELESVTGIADPAAGDVTLFLPTLQNQSPLEAENALRHAVSHVLLARVSGGKLPWGFDEGIAQYVERPVNERLARTAAMVQAANQRGELASWFDMNRTNASVEPVLAGAQSYAVVAFLVERYEIGPLRQFLRELPTAPSWREALRLAYGRDPNAIEKQWKEDLPRWTSGGWRTNLVAAFNLEPAKQLLTQANYAAAKEALEPSQTLFRQLNEPEQLAAVEALIAQCDIGIQAESLMTQTQQALELHTYDRAANLLAQAKLQFEQLPEEQRPLELIATYETLAGDGAKAAGQLDQAIQLSHSWRDYPDAREAALGAGTTFARLGDEEGMNRADQELSELDQRQRQIVLLLGALAVLTLAWLALWLWARGPSELDWR